MQTESIVLVLNDLNTEQRNSFRLESLSENVDYGIFDNILDLKGRHPNAPKREYRFYLVKEQSGKYVAAIYVMWDDLHWVVLPENRKSGVLIKPLIEIVIPHMFNEQDEIKISIDKELGEGHYHASSRIASKVGFIKIREENDVSEWQISKVCTSFVP